MDAAKWRLGGPSRFVRTLGADLEQGKSAIAVLPRHGVPDGLEAAVEATLPEVRVDRLAIGALGDGARGDLTEGLYAALDLSRLRPDEQVDVISFAHHPDLGQRVIWMNCCAATPVQARAWGDFLKDYSSAIDDVPMRRRAVFATLCHATTAGAVPDSDRTLTKRWWWGVVGRLDTATYVDEILDGRDNLPAFAETVTEIAGFDLDIATTLVDGWDGSFAALQDLLVTPSHLPDPGEDNLTWSAEPASYPRPPSESEAAWDSGVINAWGRQDPHVHACYLCGADDEPTSLRHLIWRAQVGDLLPRIEIERQALARWVYERRDHLPPDFQEQDVRGLEVGRLATLFNATPALQRDRTRLDHVQWLRRARNRLAHLDILDITDLEHARRIFKQATQMPG